MIGFLIAGAATYLLYKKLNAQPGLTSANPQPAQLKPLPVAAGGVGLSVQTAQPQMEQAKAAILAANVPYSPATRVNPDIGTASANLPLQPGDYSLVPPVQVNPGPTPGTEMVQGPISAEPVVPLERAQMVGTLIDFGGNLL